MSKKTLKVATGIDLSKKNENMTQGMLSALEAGEYPIEDITDMKPTTKDNQLGFCRITIKMGDDKAIFGLYSGDPRIKGLKKNAEYKTVEVTATEVILK